MRSILPSSACRPGRCRRIAAAAAVAEADVEVAVGAEDELAAVVVAERLLDREQDLRSLAGIGDVGRRR